MFIELQQQKLGKVTFGDNDRDNILGIGTIDKSSTSLIEMSI